MFDAFTYSFVFLMEYQNCIRWEKEHWYGQEYETQMKFSLNMTMFLGEGRGRGGAISKE